MPCWRSRQIGIKVKGLTKSYGFIKVLSNIDLEIEKGQMAVFFGPNGAGKTTLIKILSTILRHDSGEILINGLNIRTDIRKIREIIGLISHEHFIYHNLTVSENLKFFGELYGISDLPEKAAQTVKKLGLVKKQNELVRNLSNGMKQRVSIARALIHEPEILLFDEPFVGLDNEGTALLLDLLVESKEKKKTVVITTHDIKLGLKHSDKVYVLHNCSINKFNKTSFPESADFEREYENLVSG